MRKKPTYLELATANLKESALGPLKLPYCPPNDPTPAIAELQAMTQRLQAEQQQGEDVQNKTQQTARDHNVDTRIIEQLATGIVSLKSAMHQQLLQEQQNANAAQQRMHALHTENMSRQMADTQREISRNADIQGQAIASMQSAPDRMAQAVAGEISRLPPAIPPHILEELRRGNQISAEQFQQGWAQFTADQRQLGQQLLTQQSTGQQALMDKQDQNMQATLNQMAQLQTQRDTALVSQDQSVEMARRLMQHMFENLMQMFGQAAQGHHAMNLQMLGQVAQMMQRFPNVNIMNIDARQIIPQLLTLVNSRTVNVQLPAIQTIMNTLNMPNVTPEAIQNVARQLAIANAPDETPQPPGAASHIPLPDSAELPGPAIPLGNAPGPAPLPPPPDEPDTPMITPVVQLPGEPETPQLQPPPAAEPETPQLKKRSGLKAQTSSILDYVRNTITATSVAGAANRIAAARQATPPRLRLRPITDDPASSSSQGAASSSQDMIVTSQPGGAAQTPANAGRPKAKAKGRGKGRGKGNQKNRDRSRDRSDPA